MRIEIDDILLAGSSLAQFAGDTARPELCGSWGYSSPLSCFAPEIVGKCRPLYLKPLCASENDGRVMFCFSSCHSSCYGTISSLNGEPEQGVAVEAVGQHDCAIYGEDTVTDEEGKFRLRGLLVRLRTRFILCSEVSCGAPNTTRNGPGARAGEGSKVQEPSQFLY